MAAAGAAGIVRMLEMLEDEIGSSLGLLGVTSFAELDKSYLHFGAPSSPSRTCTAPSRCWIWTIRAMAGGESQSGAALNR